MRNVLTACRAMLLPRQPASAAMACRFRVLPWDVGVRTLKTDRYLGVVESAQLAFAIRAGLLKRFLTGRLSWVNVAQCARFERPLHLFDTYTVTTRVECVDDKHAYLSFRFASAAGEHAVVLLKTKFKQGRKTVPPRELLGACTSQEPALVLLLDAVQNQVV
jgi:acyl-CoA thioesterase FadM